MRCSFLPSFLLTLCRLTDSLTRSAPCKKVTRSDLSTRSPAKLTGEQSLPFTCIASLEFLFQLTCNSLVRAHNWCFYSFILAADIEGPSPKIKLFYLQPEGPHVFLGYGREETFQELISRNHQRFSGYVVVKFSRVKRGKKRGNASPLCRFPPYCFCNSMR